VDVILHLAGQVSLVASLSDPVYDFETNALGTFNVLEATRRFRPGAKLIYASSNKVYGDLRGLRTGEEKTRYALLDYLQGLSEDLPMELHGGYSCSKGAADQYVLDYHRVYDLSTVALRQSSIYGGGQYASEDQGWVAYFVQMGVERRKFRISGTGKQVRDLLHISDLIKCYRAIARSPRESLAFGQAFNIGGGPRASVSLIELFAMLKSEYGFPMQYDAGPARMGDQKVFIADTRKAQQHLGWQPSVSVAEGLAELIEWSKARWAA
jgi:CDP-paratose 2-epimerase